MPPTEISLLLLILNSEHADASLGWSEKIRKEKFDLIESRLLEKKDEITPEVFGKICYGIHT
jgi:hypothetical protein